MHPGYNIVEKMDKQELKTIFVRGMDCACDADEVRSEVLALPGVAGCEVNFTSGKVVISGEAEQDEIFNRLRSIGYEVGESQLGSQFEGTDSKPTGFFHYAWRDLETRVALLGAVLITPAVIAGELLGIESILVNLLAIVALIVAGFPVYRKAWRSARRLEISIDVLMSTASIGALLIGAYVEAGMVMVLFAIGETLEGYTNNRARESIQSMMQIVPERASLRQVHQGHVHEVEVDVGKLKVGDVIFVRPGERIPMDGEVISGESSVNQAPITGESRLLDKRQGDQVFAGTVNGNGSLEVRITHLAEDNTISRMIALIEEAQERRAPAQRFVDRFAEVYTPAVVSLAILVALLPPLLFNQPFLNPGDGTTGWLYRGLALLVVACPCALVIGIPVTVVSALSNGARNGALIKGGAFLESLNSIRSIAFDKTGTLTLGTPTVIGVRTLSCDQVSPSGIEHQGCVSCDELVGLASAVERRSEHPLAYAILNESVRRGVYDRYPAAVEVQAQSGRGVTGLVQNQSVLLGSHDHFDRHVAHPTWHCDQAAQDVSQGFTPVMVGAAEGYLGTITVADTLRSSSQQAISELKRLGVETLVLLTGDESSVAHRIAEQLGLSEIRAGLLPEQKVEAVEELRQVHGSMAMVGDGINDAPALVTADIGIAIGAASVGSAQAMEAADITLMSEDLRKLPFLFRLAKATRRTIWANIVFSIGIKLVFMFLVLVGTGSMWMAVLADMGTSLLVTLNGMRLLRRPTSSRS
jgi:Cd2+/Zn2+-exporting ATPase